MTEPRGHDEHDALLIAAHAAGDLTGRERDEAERLLADCAACATLHDDLRTLARVTRDLPTPARPRDYTLTPEDAARLRRRSWRGLLGALAGPRFSLAGPVSAGLTTLGLAGLLLVALPGFSFGGPAALSTVGTSVEPAQPAAAPAATDTRVGEETGLLNSSGGSPVPFEGAPGGAAGGAEGDAQGGGQAGEPSGGGTMPVTAAPPSERDAAGAERTTDTTLLILSGTFLILGLGLFGLRWTARRLDDG